MKRTDKVIITCAITGSIHTPTMSPYLPITPQQIADEAVLAAQAGAAVIHLHARDPVTGRPTPDPDIFMQFLPQIRERCDAVVNITTGGAPGMTMHERLAAPKRAKPELTSLNMGTLNFGVFGLAEKYEKWTFDWEQPFLESSRAGFQSNTFAQIERVMTELGEFGTRFEFECYDVSHLYTLAHFADRGLVRPPFFVQCIFGVLGGIGIDLDNLMHMRMIADRLFGTDYYLSCFGIGRHQMQFLTLSAMLGGNVRVGLEDSLYIGKGQLARSNAEQVQKICRILEELSLSVATPQEARQLLALKGADRVAF
jgi:uncharacterized protein (DUF849 family)